MGRSPTLGQYIGKVYIRYSGPPLRNNAVVEKTMGISTTEVITALDAMFGKQPDGKFPESAACGPQLWLMLTGKQRGSV